jgi:Flp pilus assembly protein TadB
VAQTKRRRQTKHRGNAAGVVESRGRTGRKPTAAEKSGGARATSPARDKRLDRLDRPPTWRGSFLRALVAAGVLLVIAGLVLHASAGAQVAYFAFALVAYTPITYYTDQWMYKRRMRNKGRRAGGKA